MKPEVTLEAIKAIVEKIVYEAVEASELRLATATNNGFQRLETRIQHLETKVDHLEKNDEAAKDQISGISHRLDNLEIEQHGTRTQLNRVEVVLTKKIPIIEKDIHDVRTHITKLELNHLT